MAGKPAPAVRHRHVFFIAGFDPKRPRYYHALYRSHARRQAAVSGLEIAVGRERSQPTDFSSAWTLHAAAPAGGVRTCYELLQWDDIVRAHWSDSALQVLADGIRTVGFGLVDGAVQRMYRLFRPPVYATFFPLVVLLLSALAAGVLGGAAAWLLGSAAPQLPRPAAWLAGLVTAVLALGAAIRTVHRIDITWLLRLVRFTHLQASGRVPQLDQRLDRFAERIAVVAAAEPPPDEIVVVGHSVGATLAISALARLLRAGRATQRAPIALLSLGHCIPLLSALSPAREFRAELHEVAQSEIDWLDITAPIDWAAFPAVDPVGGAGLPPAPPGWHPRLLSPRFHRLFGPVAYARLKRNRFQVHLQYLMAAERADAYDYFAITAGPQTLRGRFAEPAGAGVAAAAASDTE